MESSGQNHVAESMLVYIFQSTVSDFNYYSQRDSILIVSSEDGIAHLIASDPRGYLLVSDKDLKKIGWFKQKREVVTEQRLGERKWNSLRLPSGAS